MNQEYFIIQKSIQKAEADKISGKQCLYRQGFHIMPPTGWLNDPNGLCQFGDDYHLFFQYSPLDVRGGMKVWGHYVTKDFEHYIYAGAPFVPDMPFDRDGVYSGSTLIDENGMHIFYTGNVKLPGKHDYTTSGRRADVVMTESMDGIHFTDKTVVIDTDDFPPEYSCHIRDPKVWKEDGAYYMVLGGRTRWDEGRILVYTSFDMIRWEKAKELMTNEPFGYMWECPDMFLLDNKYITAFSPQGLPKQEFFYQNIYQSGYFISELNPLTSDSVLDTNAFIEWDMGFDFYAPQTFMDTKGRRILIGWAGVPDAEYENAEAKSENWQHCFTVPRKLTVGQNEDGVFRVYQEPIEEITNLRTGECIAMTGREIYLEKEYLDIDLKGLPLQFSITIADGVTFSYNGKWIELALSRDTGLGRDNRKAKISFVNSLRILVDSSILEYYINDGEMAFTTRYYKKEKGITIQTDFDHADITIYPMKEVEVEQWEN